MSGFNIQHSKSRPFDNLTLLEHLNTRLVQYLDGIKDAAL